GEYGINTERRVRRIKRQPERWPIALSRAGIAMTVVEFAGMGGGGGDDNVGR
ncbi:hypothetical protein A2U01_0066015, partial [Trifolium medium]|nr:hypothetical protein [Trifolium medium]